MVDRLVGSPSTLDSSLQIIQWDQTNARTTAAAPLAAFEVLLPSSWFHVSIELAGKPAPGIKLAIGLKLVLTLN